MADDIVTRLRDTAYESDVCWEAAAEIERLRAAGDELVTAIRNHDLTEHHLKTWEEARRGATE